jgi:cytoskeleton protein RodZ
MEVSVREVADALNLPNRVIECLEADDYDRLPPTVFTRGYLRSYARLLELPADEMLALYPEVEPDTETVPIAEVPSPGLGAGQNRLILAGAGAAIVLVVIAIWLFSGGEDTGGQSAPLEDPPGAQITVSEGADSEAAESIPPESIEPEDIDPEGATPEGATPEGMTSEGVVAEDVDRQGAEQESPAPETMPPVPEAVVEIEAAQDAAEVPRVPDAPAEPAPETTLPETEEAVSEAIADAPGPSPAAPVTPQSSERRITDLGDDRVEMQFSEDCWVEVRSPDGANLYSDLNRAGRTLTLVGRGPFRIRLGYAPGVRLSYNGDTVPIERYTRNNVANLVVGEAQ